MNVLAEEGLLKGNVKETETDNTLQNSYQPILPVFMENGHPDGLPSSVHLLIGSVLADQSEAGWLVLMSAAEIWKSRAEELGRKRKESCPPLNDSALSSSLLSKASGTELQVLFSVCKLSCNPAFKQTCLKTFSG